VSAVRPLGEDRLEIDFACPPDCPLGEHPFVLVSPSGISELVVLQVGNFPRIEEQEPNDDPENAQAITPGVTIEGVLEATDADLFRIELQAGERLSAEAQTLGLGSFLVDSVLEVFDPQGNSWPAATTACSMGRIR
jgi:hypothetical protein